MTEEMKSKLVKILKDNTKWPLIIEGVSSANFPTSVVIPATTPSSELGIIPSETGLKLPSWAMEILLKVKKSKKIIVCIGGLDEISQEKQEKFYGMIKYKGVNGFKFPEGTQIIITAKNTKKISKRISSLALSFKVE